SGGGALYGHDGWLTHQNLAVCGLMTFDSVEISEQKYPIMIKTRAIREESQGFGEWCGAPGSRVEILQRFEEGSWMAICNGHTNPPKGIHNGRDGKRSEMHINTIKNPSTMWEE